MTYRQHTIRAAAALAVVGALALAGCGGGGSAQSVGPLPASQTGNTTTPGGTILGAPAAYLTVTLPNTTSSTTSSTRRTVFSSARTPTYIDTTTKNSAIVASVTPQDPSEAAQYGNLTVCYNLYTNGSLNGGSSGNYITTPAVGGAGVNVTQVQIAIPAPPGTDGFQITQYAGQCGTPAPFTVPTAPPGVLGTSNILSQTPVTLAYMVPGVTNNLNIQIANCTPAPVPAGSPCPSGTGLGAPAVLAGSITVASIAFGGAGNLTTGVLPIASPVREQGGFLIAAAGAQRIGIPIPLEALNAGGTVIPGLTNPATPNGGAGPFPNGVTVTSNDATTHTKLFLVDATTGGIAQIAASNAAGLSIHEFNAISANTTTGLTNQCNLPALTSSCNDNTNGGGTAGDPWVIVMTFDGVDASIIGTVTVTATATINGTVQTITTTISPQSAVYTAGGTGYADVAAPAAPLNMLAQGATVYFTDGNTVKIDGTATVSSAVGTKLAGLAYATWPSAATQTTKYIYATDNAQASGSSAVEVGSGVYSWVAGTLTAPLPVAAQAGSSNFLKFNKPLGVCQAQGPDLAYYLYVIDSAGAIWQLDLANLGNTDGNGFALSTNSVQLTTSGTALSPGAATFLGTSPIAIGANTGCLIADPGNNRIALLNTVTGAITPYASGQPFIGLALSGAAAVYATTTAGQIYYISGSGATPSSFGLTTGATADGPVGPISSLIPAASLTLAPTVYALQGKAGAFFDNTTAFTGLAGAAYSSLSWPYTILPFPGGKAFAAVPNAGLGLANDTNGAAVTGAGKVQAKGGLVVTAAGGAAAATVTPDSILFVDNGTALRTLVR